MPVRILKHETRCKICVHPKAQEINALLEKRSNREKADDGTRYTLAVVLQILGGWGVINPTEENVKLHVKNHIEFLAAETIEINKAEEQEIIEKINSGEMKMADLDEGMRFLATVYIEQQKAKFARGEELGITHDHFLKLVGESTKRKHNDAQDRLLLALGGGIGMVFKKALSTPAPPALPSGDVIEGEVIRVEDGD